MLKFKFKTLLLGGASVLCLAAPVSAENFNIPDGDLEEALNTYVTQTGVHLIVSEDAIRGIRTKGVKGNLTADQALSRILAGSGFAVRNESGVLAIVRGRRSSDASDVQIQPMHLAQAAPAQRAAVETVTVTSSKLGGGDVQSIPIAITALSQEQLTATQTAGGPDLVKQVPNLTFTKTNFTGYSIQIRGIGTQAISVATDPAAAVAFNDTPFIRNHFFEQEFYDLAQVEVLRGPQGTLYGRNATAGVVNITSAKPTDQFEAMASADIGNYKNRRFEGMINIPFVSDKLDLRIAGEWTKRDGYTLNETTGDQTDGRDLWSGRATLGWKPASNIQTYFIWEHFQEDDDRLRSSKQLCKTDYGPGASSLTDTGSFRAADGTLVTIPAAQGNVFNLSEAYFSQGCLPASLYAKESFGVPNGFSLPFINGASYLGFINTNIDPYASITQSTNLRDIQSAIQPKYLAKNDTVEWNTSWNVTPNLTFNSDTGYNRDFLWSSEDYNRFDTSPGIFTTANVGTGNPYVDENGVFCDHQLGCSDRLVVQDLATEHSWQMSQEFRLSSNYSGPFNFSAGGNYLHYETEENYYVFSNTFTMIAMTQVNCSSAYTQNVTDHLYCLGNGRGYNTDFANNDSTPTESPQYLDPNPISSLDNEGHNYFVSQNPYDLNSYALFGEGYYNITPDLKLTGGLRWTDDQKHFTDIPSELLVQGYGYPIEGTVDQTWKKFTGRAVVNWTPKLSFTDQSLFYASYAHGYKAGGANPPGPVLLNANTGSVAPGTGATVNINFPVHPLTFQPEYIDAFELGTKNTALDGALTFNGDAFFYDYKGYQISQIVDRTAINLNFDATVEGAELEATWEPVPGLKFTFGGGYEKTRIDNGQQAIDLIDRTAGHPGWVVMKPSVGQSSNCILPEYVAAAVIQGLGPGSGNGGFGGVDVCGTAYSGGLDPVTLLPYAKDPTVAGTYGATPPGYVGYDPFSVDPNAPAGVNNGLGLPPNNGEGFTKDVSGNELPNAPHFTVSLGADYSIPVTPDWAATLHSDFYWQASSWARVFNDNPYDRIHGYTNMNLALILTDQSGWQVMGYVKNVFDTTAITGDFLNSDDSGLTTNIFLTDPRLFGVRVTKHFEGGPSGGYGLNFFSDTDPHRSQLWVQVGGNFNATLADGADPYDPLAAKFFPNGGDATPSWDAGLLKPAQLQKIPNMGLDWEGSVALQPADSDWVLKAGVRYGRSSHNKHFHESVVAGTKTTFDLYGYVFPCSTFGGEICVHGRVKKFDDSQSVSSEEHMMLDFTLGKDVGIGAFGGKGISTIGGGIRIAQFNSQASLTLGADPHYNFVPEFAQKYHELWEFDSHETRTFRGIGPELTWDASRPLFGDADKGELTLDWGVNAAVLFGRQKVALRHDVNHCDVQGVGTLVVCEGQTIAGNIDARIFEPPDNVNRSRTVAVPNLGGYVGASMRYRNSKISLGYRADTFFGAIDGGEETHESYNRGFYGPYLNISLGLGG